MRLKDKVAIILGAGQGPGTGVGNGKAVSVMFAREGAKVWAVDKDPGAAAATVAAIAAEGGVAQAAAADVVREESLKATITACMAMWGRVDILHYNVGVSLGGGDQSPLEITEEAFDTVTAINLRGLVMAAKHVVPIMRAQTSGSIIAISSVAAYAASYPTVAYKTTKAGMIAFIEQIAAHNAAYGVRANVILPGLLDTPMAVDTRAREWGRPREEVAAERDARVRLRGKQGTAWDVAYAAVFLASDEANFITGVTLPVDGGGSLRGGS